MHLPQGMSIKKWRRFFPLKSTDDLSKLFQNMFKTYLNSSNNSQLEHQSGSDINLTFLSLLLGIIEHRLTHIPTSQSSIKRRRHSTSSSRSSKSHDVSHHVDLPADSPANEAENQILAKGHTLHDLVEEEDDASSPANQDTRSEHSIDSQKLNEERQKFPCITFEELDSLYKEILELLSPLMQNAPFEKLQSLSTTSISTEGKENNNNNSVDMEQVLNPLNNNSHLKTDHTINNSIHTLSSTSQNKKDGKMRQQFASRQIISNVANFIWSRILIHQKYDKLHSQSIYSLLSERYLDCFGLAYSVVAVCQLLGFNHVYLALSEDHAWIEFQSSLTGALESAEVMHGPGFEDKRGQPVSPTKSRESWLYMAGWPVICRSKIMTVAAAVTAINPKITFQNQSDELLKMKRMLLRILRDCDALSSYPLALSNLAELEDLELNTIANATSAEPSIRVETVPLDLYRESVSVASRLYADHHVYPYILLAGYLYRCNQYKEAMHYWAEAARVVGRYNYEREDVEIYKEFNEIAYQLIPNILRKCTEHPEIQHSHVEDIAHDPACYADMLRFLDGLCLWEQGSSLPVLHVGWANRILFTLLRFDPKVRTQISIINGFDENNQSPSHNLLPHHSKSHQNSCHAKPLSTCLESSSPPSSGCVLEEGDKVAFTSALMQTVECGPFTGSSSGCVVDDRDFNWSSSSCGSRTPRESALLLESFDIASLGQECSRHLINPDFLLGISVEPFLPEDFELNVINSQSQHDLLPYLPDQTFPDKPTALELSDCIRINPPPKSETCQSESKSEVDRSPPIKPDEAAAEMFDRSMLNRLIDVENNNHPSDRDVMSQPPVDKGDSLHEISSVTLSDRSECEEKTEENLSELCQPTSVDSSQILLAPPPSITEEAPPEAPNNINHTVVLKSAKMCELGRLLTCAKLNASAIQLQLTAQSQVQFKRVGSTSTEPPSRLTRKRLRRV